MLPAMPQERVYDASMRCVPATEFRNALSRLATAVSVVTTDGPAGTAGVTCSAVCALSDDPAMVLVCVHGKSATNTAIKSNRNLCVNCLQSGQSDLSQAFAGIGGMPMPQRFALSTWDSLGNRRAALQRGIDCTRLRSRGSPRCRDTQHICREGSRDSGNINGRAVAISAAHLCDHVCPVKN